MLVPKLNKNSWCWGSWPNNNNKEVHIIALLVMKCLLPLSMIIVAYIRIGQYVKDNRLPPASAGPSTTCLKNRVARENMRLIRTLSAMVVLFAIFTVPHQVGRLILTLFHDKNTAGKIFAFSPLLNHFHSCVNPLVYGALTRHFRRGYIKYLAYIFCCLKSLACYRKALGENFTCHQPDINNVNQPINNACARFRNTSPECDDNAKDSNKTLFNPRTTKPFLVTNQSCGAWPR